MPGEGSLETARRARVAPVEPLESALHVAAAAQEFRKHRHAPGADGDRRSRGVARPLARTKQSAIRQHVAGLAKQRLPQLERLLLLSGGLQLLERAAYELDAVGTVARLRRALRRVRSESLQRLGHGLRIALRGSRGSRRARITRHRLVGLGRSEPCGAIELPARDALRIDHPLEPSREFVQGAPSCIEPTTARGAGRSLQARDRRAHVVPSSRGLRVHERLGLARHRLHLDRILPPLAKSIQSINQRIGRDRCLARAVTGVGQPETRPRELRTLLEHRLGSDRVEHARRRIQFACRHQPIGLGDRLIEPMLGPPRTEPEPPTHREHGEHRRHGHSAHHAAARQRGRVLVAAILQSRAQGGRPLGVEPLHGLGEPLQFAKVARLVERQFQSAERLATPGERLSALRLAVVQVQRTCHKSAQRVSRVMLRHDRLPFMRRRLERVQIHRCRGGMHAVGAGRGQLPRRLVVHGTRDAAYALEQLGMLVGPQLHGVETLHDLARQRGILLAFGFSRRLGEQRNGLTLDPSHPLEPRGLPRVTVGEFVQRPQALGQRRTTQERLPHDGQLRRERLLPACSGHERLEQGDIDLARWRMTGRTQQPRPRLRDPLQSKGGRGRNESRALRQAHCLARAAALHPAMTA